MLSKSNILFKDLASEWLAQKSIVIKNSTYVKYKNSLNKHILPDLGNIKLKDINNQIMLHYINSKLSISPENNSKLSNKTVKDMLLIINNIIKYGKKYYPEETQPLEIVYPSVPRNEIRVISHTEQNYLEQILYKDMDNVKLGILICLYTGLRLGEICGLKWEDISLSDETISVKRTVQRLQTFNQDGGPKTQIYIGTPKSDTSIRKIPIPCSIIPSINRFYHNGIEGYILSEDGLSCVDPRTMENKFHAYFDTAMELCSKDFKYEYKTGEVTFHSLRHTFATRCVEAGFEVKCLSEILGHSNVNITLNRYVHSSFQMKRDNMKKLDNLYKIVS